MHHADPLGWPGLGQGGAPRSPELIASPVHAALLSVVESLSPGVVFQVGGLTASTTMVCQRMGVEDAQCGVVGVNHCPAAAGAQVPAGGEGEERVVAVEKLLVNELPG